MDEVSVSIPNLILQRVQSLGSMALDDISSRYTIKEELGSGAQATVYKANNKKTNQKVAIKVLEMKELEDDDLFEALRLEVVLMRQLKHPNIVSLQEVCNDKVSVYIVQECLGGGELFDKLLAKGPFNEEETLAIFAQVALALDYMHSVNVVHRDLKAENLVFVAKGSPQIKFIDFGGAAPFNDNEGLTGLVGTPQYVAPEVVTGFGDHNPTEVPYGKACDLWSLGVLLYVMLSKMMPFRAKEVELLLKQVVKGRFTFKPEEKWRLVSHSARDLISKLLVTDPAKRITIAQVKEHPWAREAILKCEQNMPKLEAKVTKSGKSGGGFFNLADMGGILKASLAEASTSSKDKGKGIKPVVKKNKGVSREQQYWYAMEISPPSDMQVLGGVKVGADGNFEMENVPPEMKAILDEIARKKAQEGYSGRESSAALGAAGPSEIPPPPPRAPMQPAAPPGPPPPLPSMPPGGPPPLPTTHAPPACTPPPPLPSSMSSPSHATPPPPPPPPPPLPTAGSEAEMHRLTAENLAYTKHQTSDAMDTLVLIGEKDAEIAALSELTAQQASQIEELQQELASASASAGQAPPPAVSADQSAEVANLRATLKEVLARAERAEALAEESSSTQMKLQAKLAAVTTLYTESMQREACLKVTLEHGQRPAA